MEPVENVDASSNENDDDGVLWINWDHVQYSSSSSSESKSDTESESESESENSESGRSSNENLKSDCGETISMVKTNSYVEEEATELDESELQDLLNPDGKINVQSALNLFSNRTGKKVLKGAQLWNILHKILHPEKHETHVLSFENNIFTLFLWDIVLKTSIIDKEFPIRDPSLKEYFDKSTFVPMDKESDILPLFSEFLTSINKNGLSSIQESNWFDLSPALRLLGVSSIVLKNSTIEDKKYFMLTTLRGIPYLIFRLPIINNKLMLTTDTELDNALVSTYYYFFLRVVSAIIAFSLYVAL